MNYKESATLKPDQLPTPEVLRETAARIVPPPAPRPPYVPKAPPTAMVPPVDLAGLEDVLRSPLAGLAHQIAALTFHELMSLTTEITGREGYAPPATAYDLAALLNDWAQAQMKTSAVKGAAAV
jgi:hypothetical protein